MLINNLLSLPDGLLIGGKDMKKRLLKATQNF
jgi:hypothetical protein